MKHRKQGSKIKYEHDMIKGLREKLEAIDDWPEIVSIIPAKINVIKKFSKFNLKFKVDTTTGIKCLAYSGNAVQEVFIVSNVVENLKKKLMNEF